MTQTTARRDADDQIVFTVDGLVTTLPTEEGDTPAHAQLAAWLRKGGKIEGPAAVSGMDVAAGHALVDAAAETARLKYLTAGMGQSLTYQAKAEEIRRYDQDTNPVKTDYPYLSAEIGVTGSSLTAVADVVREAVQTWQTKGPEIERTRLKAKADISKAEAPGRIESIVSAIEWP